MWFSNEPHSVPNRCTVNIIGVSAWFPPYCCTYLIYNYMLSVCLLLDLVLVSYDIATYLVLILFLCVFSSFLWGTFWEKLTASPFEIKSGCNLAGYYCMMYCFEDDSHGVILHKSAVICWMNIKQLPCVRVAVFTSSVVHSYLLSLVCFRLTARCSSVNLRNWSVVKRLVNSRHICTFVWTTYSLELKFQNSVTHYWGW